MRFVGKKIFFVLFAQILLTPHLIAFADIPYVHGVNYLPEHYSDYYDGINLNSAISDDAIESDFFIMSQNFDAVRTYEYDKINLQRILRAAKRYNMKAVVGIEIDPSDISYTNSQVDGLNQMFQQYPDLLDNIIAIVVGNAVLRNYADPKNDVDFLMQQYNKIAQFSWFQKSKIDLSVSERDTTYLNKAGAMLLQKLPKNIPLFVNINPYMSGCTVDGAIENDRSCRNNSFQARWQALVSNSDIKTHQIIVGESGWPTEGPGVKLPTATQRGSLVDAIKYYQFLYPFLRMQKVNGKSVPISFFSFAAFDEPMRGIFGFVSNFWGVYNSDSSPKIGMIYPLSRTVIPKPKTGTNVRINLPSESAYNNTNMPVLFYTKGSTYTNKLTVTNVNTKSKQTNVKQMNTKEFSFLNNLPYVHYSLSGSNIVSLVLPDGKDETHRPATCTNELISGNGYGVKSQMNLNWKYPHSKEDNCEYINWAENGVWIN